MKVRKLREFYSTRRVASQTTVSQPNSQLNVHQNAQPIAQTNAQPTKQPNAQHTDQPDSQHNDQTNEQHNNKHNEQPNNGLPNEQSNDKINIPSEMPRSIRQLSKPLVKAPGDVECGNPNCRTKYASAWRTNPEIPEGGWLCNACGIFIRTKGVHRPPEVVGRVYKNNILALPFIDEPVPRKETLRKRKNPEPESDDRTPSTLNVVTRRRKSQRNGHGTSSDPDAVDDEDIVRSESSQDDVLNVPTNEEEPLPWERKEFLKCGLYSMDLKVGRRSSRSKEKESENSITEIFPLPVQYGKFLMEEKRNFHLTWDIITAHKHIYVDRKRKNEEPVICDCKPPRNGGLGCTEDCYNRVMFYECSPKDCPCEEQCTNQRFQRKECVKELEVFKTENRGYGLRTLVETPKDQLILEYRGEVISHSTALKRMETKYKYRKSIYFLDYENRAVVDGGTRGTEARFINHSCAPNCHIEKWRAPNGELFIGVFASYNIPAMTELTYDYNFSTFGGAEGQECLCGASNCRGILGGKKQFRK
ncbi:4325_t:CDS:2 [Diversispora eburnea]|uniref:4325_t:CDS:1 n=1 Tax=Diversispora eburnea TaxID=1213867 RepID=A0A9N9FDR6_9GLOM|nr:4325_t:CDS:2 [Diversispora eburnea]